MLLPCFCLFLLIIPRPPTSTLFPYTTLFRSSRTSMPAATLVASTRIASVARNASGSTRRRLALSSSVRSSHWPAAVRSEEHTSELQSHSDLVCRLLLEKKKQNNNNSSHLEKA